MAGPTPEAETCIKELDVAEPRFREKFFILARGESRKIFPHGVNLRHGLARRPSFCPMERSIAR